MIVLGVFLVLVAGLFLVLWYFSPGTMETPLDSAGAPCTRGIAEKIFVPINGVTQGMIIRSCDTTQPVLLFLHGGPGMPEHFLARKYPTGLEDLFTVCWWEQPGAGLSFDSDMSSTSLTVERLLADAIAVTEYLRQRFRTDRIYLMGHSNGTILGTLLAARAPRLYHAYIGIAQVSYQLRSERLAYEYVLKEYTRRGDVNMVEKLRRAKVTGEAPLPQAWLSIRDEVMHELGVGTMRSMRSVITGIFIPSLLCKEYTMAEKLKLWRGKIVSQKILRDVMWSINLPELVPSLDIPVYVLHGSHDYTCSYTESREYVRSLHAPVKGFYTFTESAHSPLFEEAARMRAILTEDVLQQKAALADTLR